MIIDSLHRSELYHSLHPSLPAAFAYLRQTDLAHTTPGKYQIDGDNLFAIIQEYDTMDAANERMESHRRYMDVQYMINGAEYVGLALYGSQTVSRDYSEEEDYMLYADAPQFFAPLAAGSFMIFHPHDLHMPCLMIDTPQKVKKVVVKVRL